MQGQFPPGPSPSQGPYYPQTTVYPMGQPSPPVYIGRVPTAPMTGMPQFQTQNFDPRARERKTIQLKDPNSNRNVAQEILNRQPLWSSRGSTGGTSNNSRTPPLSSQQQAEANVRAQFAAQVAATLADDSETKGSMSEDSESENSETGDSKREDSESEDIKTGDSEMEQYRPRQSRQGQFQPVSGPSPLQGPYYPQTAVYPMGQPSPPVYIGRTPTASMTGMPQFQTQNVDPRARERKIIQLKDPNSNRDVTQEILNHQPSWSSRGSTSGTSTNSRTPPLSSQQQAEANVRAQFAAQVAATLANDSERKGSMSKDSESENSETGDSKREDSESEDIKAGDSKMERYRPQQSRHGQFQPVSGPSPLQGPYYPQTAVYPMGQPSPPVYIGRTPTASMTGMPQFQTQNVDPRAPERKIIQLKDPNSNRDVTQEILNRQPSWSSRGSTSGTSNNSRTPPLSSQQQAEANVRAQFAAQVAATLANDSETKGSMSEDSESENSETGDSKREDSESEDIKTGDSEMEQYRPRQSRQGQFQPVSGPSPLQGPYYPQTAVYPMGQPSPPVYIGRTPTASMTGMPQFQTQNVDPRARERKIIQLKDPNSNRDVTQEILNRQPSWSSRGSTSGTSNNSRTPPLSSQQQAEANMRAQFAAQVAATLANDSERKGSMSEDSESENSETGDSKREDSESEDIKAGDSEMERYRPRQSRQGQFQPVSGPSPLQGPYYPQTAVYPMGQPSPPVYIGRTPTASMTGMPQFQTQNVDPRARERKIIQLKDPNSNRDVTQEILNRQPSWSSRGSTTGTSNNSRTPPLSSQQQAEANVRAQFAAQVAATLANDSERKGSMSEDSESENSETGDSKREDSESEDIKAGDSEMERYRPQQSRQGQFQPVSGLSLSQGPYYPQTAVYPMGQPSPPVYIGRTPTASMTGMPQFQTQNVDPRARERKIIQLKDPNSNRDVTQEILNRQPSWSSRGSTGGTSNNSRTPPLSSQQQAEANMRAQFAVQVAATLDDDSERKGSMSEDSESENSETGDSKREDSESEDIKTGDSEMERYRPQQSRQGQFQPVSGPSPLQGPYYPQTAVYPMGQPSPPVYIGRTPTASMTGMPQFQTQNVDPRAPERKIIQLKDPNSNRDVTQEILNRQPSWSSRGSTGGTSSSSRTPPPSSQQQAEANVRAQFAAQVAATLANDSERKGSMSEDSESESSETGDSKREHKESEDIKTGDSEMEQYRPRQSRQGQFQPVSGPSLSQGPYYPQTAVYPMGQPSPPVYIGRTPTASMTGMPQFQTQNFDPRAGERKIIQLKDPNSNRDVTQEILNRQPSWSSRGSTGGTSNNSRTPPLSSQRQAEANMQAQFAAQVAATLANDSERKGSMSEDSESENSKTGDCKREDIKAEDSDMEQYRSQQSRQGQFPPVSGPPPSQGPYYPQTTVYPMGQPSPPPVYIVRAPTAPMTGMPQFQTQNVDPRARERKLIQLKDPNSDRDVAKEILNRQPFWSSRGSTGGTSNNSRTPPLSSQQQADANMRAQFAGQVAATLADDSERKSSMSEDRESGNSETGDCKREDSESEDIKTGDSEMEQYRPRQSRQGQFPSGPSPSQGPHYQQTTVYPMRQPSPPVYIGRAPTAPMIGMPQFQTQNFDPRAREKKIIQLKDPNSNRDVAQEILNRQPLWSSRGSTGGTSNNSRTPPLSSQQQAEANMRAQFAAQVAATLANDSERKGSMSEDSESGNSETGDSKREDSESEDIKTGGNKMERYRPQQLRQGQFPPVSGPSLPQGAYYPQTTVYPMGQPSPPVYIGRAPTAPMTGMLQFQTQNFDPCARERKIIQIKDPNSNRDVAQEILNRQPSWSSRGSTGGTSNNSRTPPLSSQQQAEANMRAQFAAQVAATLANDSERKGSMSEDRESKNNETGDCKREDSESEDIKTGDSEMEQYKPQQSRQGQFPPVSAPSPSQGPYYPQTTVYPMGQPSPPVYIGTAPTAPMTGMLQFQTQNFEPRARERKIIQLKDPNSNRDVTQEILNRQPLWSSRGSTGGTSNNSRTPLLSQQQAEANVRAQFGAQVAASLANDSERKDSMSEDSESEGSMSEDSEMEQYRPQQTTMSPIDTNRTGVYLIFLSVFSVPPLGQAT